MLEDDVTILHLPRYRQSSLTCVDYLVFYRISLVSPHPALKDEAHHMTNLKGSVFSLHSYCQVLNISADVLSFHCSKLTYTCCIICGNSPRNVIHVHFICDVILLVTSRHYVMIDYRFCIRSINNLVKNQCPPMKNEKVIEVRPLLMV